MAQVESERRAIWASGVQLACIAAEKRDGVWKPDKYIEKHPISFPFLFDEDRAVTRAYGLRHLLAHDALNIAHPATLVIDGGAVVCWIYRGENQHDPAPWDEVMLAVTKVGK